MLKRSPSSPSPRAAKNPLAGTIAGELRALVSQLRRRLREQADAGDLTPSQTAVIHRLESDGPTTTSGLARAEGMRPQSMGTIVAALEAAELVSGSPDPADGRQTLLSLTPRCRDWLEQGRAARQDWLTGAIETRLSPEEQTRLLAALSLVARLTRT